MKTTSIPASLWLQLLEVVIIITACFESGLYGE